MKSKIQNLKPEIIIVGAGPAGTSLAIRLVKENFKVTLIEREKFPRHKLCGEFISPECLEHFRELGVLDEMLIRGGDRISETIFYSEDGKNVVVPSEWFGGSKKGALGLSRAEMDFRLMEKAKKLGVEVLEDSSVSELLFDEEKVCGVKIKNSVGGLQKVFSDLTIDATGRSKVLSKLAEREKSRKVAKSQRGEDKVEKRGIKIPKSKNQNPLVGFKAHLKNVHLEKGVCEIYFFRGGYGGLNYVEDGIANHCFLVKSEIVKKYKGDVGAILENVIFQNKRAEETLKDAENVYDWLAVSVDGFGIKELNPAENLLTIGDAAAFIDPFTGSGMLMAFESSEILAGVIAENYKESFKRVAEEYRLLHKVKFQKRLRTCRLIRNLAFSPMFAKLGIFMLNSSRISREFLVRMTRNTEIKKQI